MNTVTSTESPAPKNNLLVNGPDGKQNTGFSTSFGDNQASYDQANRNPDIAKDQNNKDKPKFLIIKDPVVTEKQNYFSRYPLGDLKVGEGFFVKNEDTIKDTLEYMRQEIYRARNYYSIAEHDENGDEVFEEVQIRVRKKVNGEFELDSSGNPVISANSVTRPKRIYSRHFSAYQIAKDDVIGESDTVAEEDGVLVIREV